MEVSTGAGENLGSGQSAARIRRLERMTADYWRQLTRTGGAYIPPKRMSAEAQALPEKDSEAYQRLCWDALRRSLNGLINKVNAANIKEIVKELICENLVRGRGIFARSIMKAQASSIIYTPVYAAVVAVLNTKFPLLGELLVKRLVSQFRKSYRRNDKTQCVAVTTFLAHLVNQHVLHDICLLQMLMLLLDRPTDDSVEIAVGLMKEVGAALGELSPKPANAVFERFRAVLHEGAIDKRVQYMIEVLFQTRKEKFKDNVAIPAELDLVEEEDQITHYIMLDDELEVEDGLNVFKFDPEFGQHEEEYETIKKEILGDEDDEEEEVEEPEAPETQKQLIKDETDTNLINFRKTAYLTIMSSLDFEECGHKLLKVNIPEGYEIELCHMIVDCCSNERNYLKFYGLLAERFCKIDELWRENFEKCFGEVYSTIHRLETNRIRNVAKLFAHLFESDAITWAILECIKLTEEDTTSASRIFIKFLMQDTAEFYGIPKLSERLREPDFQPYFAGMFPVEDDPHALRFSINFFTAIGLGGLTDDMRDRLAIAQPSLMAAMHGDTPALSEWERPPSPVQSSPGREERGGYRLRSRSRSRERHERREYRDRSRSQSREDRHPRRSPISRYR
jgi:pre-mRNA-splicing factor CWC22